MIKVNNLNFSYSKDKVIFKGLSFSLKKAEFLVLAGANGSGKSTLIDLLSGILKVDKNVILVNNKENNFKEVAVLPQNIEHWLLGETVKEDLSLGLNLKDEEVLNNYNLIAETWNLKDILNEELLTLSLGQKKRLAIASTLIKKPSIILFDEPFAGLDWPASLVMLENLKKMKNLGVTLVLATHEIKIIQTLIDKCLILNNSNDYLLGTLDDLKDKFLAYDVRPLDC